MGSPTRDARGEGPAADPAGSARAPQHTLRRRAPSRRPAGWPTTARRSASTWRRALLRDLDGVVGLSVQERMLVDVATQTWLYLSALDAWLLQQPNLVDARRRALLPALRERTQLTESLCRCFQALGVARRQYHARLNESVIVDPGPLSHRRPSLDRWLLGESPKGS